MTKSKHSLKLILTSVVTPLSILSLVFNVLYSLLFCTDKKRNTIIFGNVTINEATTAMIFLYVSLNILTFILTLSLVLAYIYGKSKTSDSRSDVLDTLLIKKDFLINNVNLVTFSVILLINSYLYNFISGTVFLLDAVCFIIIFLSIKENIKLKKLVQSQVSSEAASIVPSNINAICFTVVSILVLKIITISLTPLVSLRGYIVISPTISLGSEDTIITVGITSVMHMLFSLPLSLIIIYNLSKMVDIENIFRSKSKNVLDIKDINKLFITLSSIIFAISVLIVLLRLPFRNALFCTFYTYDSDQIKQSGIFRLITGYFVNSLALVTTIVDLFIYVLAGVNLVLSFVFLLYFRKFKDVLDSDEGVKSRFTGLIYKFFLASSILSLITVINSLYFMADASFILFGLLLLNLDKSMNMFKKVKKVLDSIWITSVVSMAIFYILFASIDSASHDDGAALLAFVIIVPSLVYYPLWYIEGVGIQKSLKKLEKTSVPTEEVVPEPVKG